MKQRNIASYIAKEARFKNLPWRGRRASGTSTSGNSGAARIKGARHPIGYSGRTIGKLIHSFREDKK